MLTLKKITDQLYRHNYVILMSNSLVTKLTELFVEDPLSDFYPKLSNLFINKIFITFLMQLMTFKLANNAANNSKKI